MHVLRHLFSPAHDLVRAVILPFKALFVVGLTGLINAATYHGVWWFKWVALGMGIAVVVALARGLRAVIVLALVAWVGTRIYQRYGDAARRQFDAWVAGSRPGASQVLSRLGSGPRL